MYGKCGQTLAVQYYKNNSDTAVGSMHLAAQHSVNTVEPGYNDIGLCDTSSIASDIVIPINSSLLTITL
jgi:hypothetical protein